MKKFHNPPTVEQPRAPYSQGISFGSNVRWCYVCGQSGQGLDGVFKKTFEEQVEQTLINIVNVLADADMGPQDLIRMTTWVKADFTGPALFKPISAARLKILGDARPTGALIRVAGFAEPEMLIEIDAIAVKQL